jgi:hypothetical protein
MSPKNEEGKPASNSKNEIRMPPKISKLYVELEVLDCGEWIALKGR